MNTLYLVQRSISPSKVINIHGKQKKPALSEIKTDITRNGIETVRKFQKCLQNPEKKD